MDTENSTLAAPESKAGPVPAKKLKPVKMKMHARQRKHKIETVSRNKLAQYLDQLHAENSVVLAVNLSLDIGGAYEVISFTEEEAQE